MRVKILLFGAARERTGLSHDELELPDGAPVSALLEAIAARRAELSPVLKDLRGAVNQEIARLEDVVPDGAEVALIPPVAGGSGTFRVTDQPLSLDEVVRAVSGEAYGGLVTFTGSVRSQTRGREVVRLEYEAYAPMAERKFREIAAEAAERWPGTRVAVVHRVGVLYPGDAAVVIAAASPHRKEAFRACEHVIDRLKQDAPIWKKEIYRDGEVWVGLGP